ncbi:hypothetical protein TNCV_3601351 [Trichonephila clavipes]|nr:hypothetical protein TNCV_3601351 [Trichonephila clavipes]
MSPKRLITIRLTEAGSLLPPVYNEAWAKRKSISSDPSLRLPSPPKRIQVTRNQSYLIDQGSPCAPQSIVWGLNGSRREAYITKKRRITTQTSMAYPGFEPRPYGIAFSITLPDGRRVVLKWVKQGLHPGTQLTSIHKRELDFILVCLHPTQNLTREAVCRSSGKNQARSLPEYTHNIVLQHQIQDPPGKPATPLSAALTLR